jgi:hypothetical protein
VYVAPSKTSIKFAYPWREVMSILQDDGFWVQHKIINGVHCILIKWGEPKREIEKDQEEARERLRFIMAQPQPPTKSFWQKLKFWE